MARPNVPILAVTASALSVDRVRCLQAGMDYHICKPLRRKELVEAISCALENPGAAPFLRTPAALTARE